MQKRNQKKTDAKRNQKNIDTKKLDTKKPEKNWYKDWKKTW